MRYLCKCGKNHDTTRPIKRCLGLERLERETKFSIRIYKLDGTIEDYDSIKDAAVVACLTPEKLSYRLRIQNGKYAIGDLIIERVLKERPGEVVEEQ
jgi:hypothetical protein